MNLFKTTFGIVCFGSLSLQAAPVVWSATPFTTHGASSGLLDTGVIANNGTLVTAQNSGGAATMFDGIAFAAGTVGFGASYNGFFDYASPLAATGTYSGAAAGATVPLTGLSPGHLYRIQVLVFDGRGGANGSYLKMDDQNMGVYGHGVSSVTWGSGMLVTGFFTADVSTQSFNLKGYYANNTPNNLMNGLLLHDLGEVAVPTCLVDVGASAQFPTVSLATDEQSSFRLGGAVRDHAAVIASGGLSVTAGSAPHHVIRITQQGPISIGRHPLISYSGAIGGLGFDGLKLDPLGALTGRLVNTTAESSIDLEITGDGTYASWENLNGLTAAGAATDSDSDGIPNGIEYVIGGPHGTDSHAMLPQVTADSSSLTFTFRRTDAAAATAGLIVESSTELNTWTEARHGDAGVAFAESDDFYGDGIDKVAVTIPMPPAPDQRMFARLRVNIPDAAELIAENNGSAPGAVTTLDALSRTTLMGDDAAITGGLAVQYAQYLPARYYMTNWTQAAQSLTWRVFSPTEAQYTVLMSSSGVPAVRLTGGRDGPLDATIGNLVWNRHPLGVIRLPQGTSTLTLQLQNDLSPSGNLRNIELLPVAAAASYAQRVAAMRADTTWIRQKGYGVMLQWGGWSYPPHGAQLPWEQVAPDFDVGKFAKMVDEDMGAKWVIWSITWRGSRFPMPLASVDAIAPGHTLQRDLMVDLIAALKPRGIKLMFYYHPGWEDPAWWAVNWVDPYHKRAFFENWIAVMSEIGDRYREDLAGIFVDCGLAYAPAPFEALARAAKTGFPGRLLGYNDTGLPMLTDFVDIQMGEGFKGGNETAIGSNGIYPSGRYQGLQAHGMFVVNSNEWGIWQPEQSTPLQVGAAEAIDIVKNANRRGQAMTFNFDMYQDATVTPATLDMFHQLKAAIYAPVPVSEGKPTTDSGHWAGNYGADQAVDGSPSTFWSLLKNERTGWMEVDLGAPTAVTRAVIQEGITPPRVPLVRQFAVEAKQADGSWLPIASGTGIGTSQTLTFAPVTAQVIRLHILDCNDPAGTAPVIGELQLFE